MKLYLVSIITGALLSMYGCQSSYVTPEVICVDGEVTVNDLVGCRAIWEVYSLEDGFDQYSIHFYDNSGMYETPFQLLHLVLKARSSNHVDSLDTSFNIRYKNENLWENIFPSTYKYSESVNFEQTGPNARCNFNFVIDRDTLEDLEVNGFFNLNE